MTGIQVMAALLTHGAEKLPDGRYIVDAQLPLIIKADAEDQISDPSDFMGYLPPMTLLVYLWNGRRGEKYTLMAVMSAPSGDVVFSTDVVHTEWRGGAHEVGRLNFGGLEVNFKGTGRYRMAILIEGDEQTEIEVWLPVVLERELRSFGG